MHYQSAYLFAIQTSEPFINRLASNMVSVLFDSFLAFTYAQIHRSVAIHTSLLKVLPVIMRVHSIPDKMLWDGDYIYIYTCNHRFVFGRGSHVYITFPDICQYPYCEYHSCSQHWCIANHSGIMWVIYNSIILYLVC